MNPAYTPATIARLGLLPYKKVRIIQMIKLGEIEAINVGTEERPRWVITDAAIQKWWKSRQKNTDLLKK